MQKTVEYTSNPETLTPEQLSGFFVGWPTAPDPETHLKILKNSYRVWLAIHNNRCIGFINAISDGVFYAYIPLLEVLPAYKNQGIGAELVRHMMKSLKHMYAVDLVCDKDVVGFYEKQAFQQGTAMLWRNYTRQHGR